MYRMCQVSRIYSTNLERIGPNIQVLLHQIHLPLGVSIVVYDYN